ncbi:MAG TPA: acetate--CoA ligase family protein [Candidatus Dormibacteraeota bacterium]
MAPARARRRARDSAAQRPGTAAAAGLGPGRFRLNGATAAARLLDARSIALVGANEASMWTQALVANLGGLGFEGEFHLVNPRGGEMLGRPVLPEIPDGVDAAYVMVGTERAPAVLEECGRRGVRSAVLLTAGFKEVGQAGAILEKRLVERAAELGIGLLGPNCLGFVNYHTRLAAYGLLVVPPLPVGAVALVSQSGAMLLHFHRMAQARGIGLAATVSIGNEGMLTAADFFEALVDDPQVKVVGALLEGIREPAGFLRAAARALEAGKPLVIYKVGHTEAGRRSISAHTGSLAGEEEVLDAVFRQHAVVRVRSLEELVETCALLAHAGWPEGPSTAVLTTSGGACGIVSDLVEGTRVEMPDFPEPVKRRLAALLPVFGTPQNPMDTTGVVVDQPALLAGCLDAVHEEGGYQAFFINSDPPREPGTNPARVEERFASLGAAVARLPFAAVAQTSAVDLTDYARETMRRHGLHLCNGLALGVRALDGAIGYGLMRTRALGRGPEAARERAAPELVEGRSGALSESDSKRLLELYGISGPEEWLAADAEEAAAAAASIGFPVVVKVHSADIAHKSAAGGVRLGVGDAEGVRRAFAAVLEAARRAHPSAVVDGALISRDIRDARAELILGAKRDPLFGPVVLVGAGGVFVESMRDVAVRLPPLDEEEALAMLGELRVPVGGDRAAAARALVAVGELALDLGERLVALDVNPLFVLERGVLAADALVVLA